MDMSSNQIFYITNPDKYILSQHGRQKKKLGFDKSLIIFYVLFYSLGNGIY